VIAVSLKLITFTTCRSIFTVGWELPKPEPAIVIVAGLVEKSATAEVMVGIAR
jgi:hypothetical protein